MNKLYGAEKATAQVQKYAHEAAEILLNGADGTIMVNFYGIFSSPHRRESDLLCAKQKIETALELLNQAAWPNESDYDEPEGRAG
jgi:hypothetical protein